MWEFRRAPSDSKLQNTFLVVPEASYIVSPAALESGLQFGCDCRRVFLREKLHGFLRMYSPRIASCRKGSGPNLSLGALERRSKKIQDKAF